MNKLIKLNEKQRKVLNKDYEFYSKYPQHREIAKKIHVIKLLDEKKSYKEIQELTDVARSTIPYLANKFNIDNNFYRNDKRRSILDIKKLNIIDLFKEIPPHSLTNACSILFSKMNIRCSKTSMKEFLDRNKLKYLIKKD